MELSEKLKDRIEKEIDCVLECEHWDTIKLHWMFELADIYKDIMEMEKATAHASPALPKDGK